MTSLAPRASLLFLALGLSLGGGCREMAGSKKNKSPNAKEEKDSGKGEKAKADKESKAEPSAKPVAAEKKAQ